MLIFACIFVCFWANAFIFMFVSFPQLNFPSYNFKLKEIDGKTYIFDIVRKKFVLLYQEEWVRQHMLHFLIYEKHIPPQMLSVERQINLHGRTKRYDIVAYKSDASIFLVVECKAPQVVISQEVFDQIARYNMLLQAEYLVVTNGLFHCSCRVNTQTMCYEFLKELPLWAE